MNALTLLRFAGAGVLATLTMDLGAGAMRAAGLAHGVPPKYIGQWFAHLLRGTVVHRNITETPELPWSLPLSLLCHYLIGIGLAVTFGLLLQYGPVVVDSRGKAFAWALAFGFLTNALPWLFMFPAMGFGWFGLQGPPEFLLLRSSGLNHMAYGVGLGLASMWVTSLWTRAAVAVAV